MSLAIVMDSLRKDTELFKDMIDMLKRWSRSYPSIIITFKSFDKYIYLFCSIMRTVWKKFIQNHRGNFNDELKLKTDFWYILDATFHYSFILLHIQMDT